MVVCEIFILIFGHAHRVGMRTLRGPVFFPIRVLATVYTDLFRGLPLILVLLLLGFGMPEPAAGLAAAVRRCSGARWH